MSTAPTLRELQGHVTLQYAADWREIGVELGLTDAKLREIREDNPHSVKRCCNRMFSEWLRVDTTASWEKLFTAIESPAVSGRYNHIVQVGFAVILHAHGHTCTRVKTGSRTADAAHDASIGVVGDKARLGIKQC